jgi:hypothetical protein
MKSLSGLVLLVLCSTAVGQATFDVQTPVCSAVGAFPTPCGAGGDPEGVSWNGVVSGVGALPSPIAPSVDATPNGVGMPCGGTQYARIHAAGLPAGLPAGGPPAGGPAPEAPGVTNAIYVPIPANATQVSFCWDFYNADSTASAAFNDGMSIDVVAACPGPAVANLVYVDSFTPVSNLLVDSACGTAGGAGLGDVAPFGVPQVFGPAPFPGGVPPAGSLLRIQVWNSGDNAFSSRGVIDSIDFVCAGGCPPLPCTLHFSSPFGPGSLQMSNTPCAAAAGANYFIAVTLAQGLTPNGWFFGLDIPWNQLVGEFNGGFPFTGTLDASGASTFGPIFAPSGLPLWAVSTQWVPPGYGNFIMKRGPKSYIIP